MGHCRSVQLAAPRTEEQIAAVDAAPIPRIVGPTNRPMSPKQFSHESDEITPKLCAIALMQSEDSVHGA
jgi:hypothetical protein